MATIALVDDEDRIRGSIKRMMEYVGHRVIEFDDAKPVLISFESEHIDLVVTDLHMKTSGEVLVTKLRERGVETPIIIITGQIAHCDVNRLLKIGAQSVLFKPFTMQELQTEIGNCISL